jgi:hypothetical protein
VPRGWKEDPSLGYWVNNQRMQYTKMKKNGTAVMEPGRILKVEQLGFEWSTLMSNRKSKCNLKLSTAEMARVKRVNNVYRLCSSLSISATVVAID